MKWTCLGEQWDVFMFRVRRIVLILFIQWSAIEETDEKLLINENFHANPVFSMFYFTFCYENKDIIIYWHNLMNSWPDDLLLSFLHPSVFSEIVRSDQLFEISKTVLFTFKCLFLYALLAYISLLLLSILFLFCSIAPYKATSILFAQLFLFSDATRDAQLTFTLNCLRNTKHMFKAGDHA